MLIKETKLQFCNESNCDQNVFIDIVTAVIVIANRIIWLMLVQ